MSTQTDITKLSFEDALTELEKIVNNLESGQIDLEKSINIYERGSALQKHCEKKLSEAKLKIDKISEKSGVPSLEPFITE